MFPLNSRILIVDDSRVMRLLARKSLSEAKYSVLLEAENGQQALEAIEEAHAKAAPIDLVFLDANMPVLTGIELVKKLKADPKHRALPIIMVTSESEAEFVAAAFDLGVNDYVVKPVSGSTLLTKMEQVAKKLGLE